MKNNNVILPNRALSESLWWNMPLRFPVYDNYPPGLYRKQYIPPESMLAEPKE